MTTYDEVRRYQSADGQRAVALYVDDHGLVRFNLLEWCEPDPESPYETKGYWAPMHLSGLYSSVDEAQKEAVKEIDWLNELLGRVSGCAIAGPEE